MTLATSRETRRALAAAAEWRLLELLFERPRPGWLVEIESLVPEIESELLRRAAAAARDGGESRYLAALGPGGAASPREVAYRGMHDPGQILADIAAFHRVFGFVPHSEEPIDHVGVEAGFVGYLRLKEAYARARHDADAAQTAASAAARFIEAHLRWFAAPFAARVDGIGPAHVALAARALASQTGDPVQAPEAAPDGDASFDCDGCTMSGSRAVSSGVPPV